MMAETTSVSVQGMQAAGDRITATETRLAGLRSEFEGIKASLASGWTGESATVFQGALAQWNTNYNTIIAALNGLQRDMAQSLATYGRTHADATAQAEEAARMIQAQSEATGLPGM
ncbi:WXG100 family type VII secretion target [Streptomyces sp. NBC_00151]|jgi:WXG100 family type VII secretion target|uniref:WXG100 family type VII secretion target n=1 Tax=Streptomyces sp. NBC_00151 TaxID=2975669 RepID=UPI002DD81679|nr:WXG100 family type VII secretion target [Streptomyces sp. NBC_00151]WRZ36760.1 WXG100 family type VII secretion target [Streptomyces sp. NBC_00151]WRZ36769.1 WXG100 family type VII secretion target [Streptomyces sp. NBC_00151]WRZ44808.1 WXG100 family type VII secretion target [Streptomyces sp. NBC_00151]WRZ44817.1 WXG100 family type VII secretion target [Streptomyces sp. NBC_00151]